MNPNFKDQYPFSKELFAVEIEKNNIKMCKPVNVGLTFSGLSKTSPSYAIRTHAYLSMRERDRRFLRRHYKSA